MGNSLPLVFTALTALCLLMVFYAVWRSVRALMSDATPIAGTPGLASDRQSLLLEKQALLQSLRDLEQERDMGKVSQDDFDAMNARLRQRAREVLKQLDAQVAPFRGEAEALVQRVSNLSGASVDEPAATSAAASETTEPSGAAQPATLTCAQCGATNEGDALFCKKCGHKFGSGEAS